MGTLRIELELTEKELEAFQAAQRELYRQRYQDEFFKDRYYLIPHELRHGSILAHCPDMRANKKLLGALKLAQGTSSTPAARGV